VLRAVQIYIAY